MYVTLHSQRFLFLFFKECMYMGRDYSEVRYLTRVSNRLVHLTSGSYNISLTTTRFPQGAICYISPSPILSSPFALLLPLSLLSQHQLQQLTL